MHAGGIADKAGNRYEAKWLIYKLFSLLSGETLNITIERLGDDSEGFEFSLEMASGVEWHQCKRQTAGVSWTIGTLHTQGVLGNFKNKVRHNATARCIFVSTDTASHLKALREKRPHFGDVEPYVKSLSQKETDQWGDLVSKIGTREETFEWLRRCEFRAQDEDGLNELVTDHSARWVKADPEMVRSVLRTWVEDDGNMNRPLKREDLLTALTDCGFQVSAYHLDQTIPGKIDLANDEYESSYGPTGNEHFAIDRAETEEIYNELTHGNARIIVLAGAAGSGKSVIVKSVAAKLAKEQVRYLAFRADQLGDPISVAAIGTRTLAIDDSPAVILEQLAGMGMAVLFVDQADALSEMSGRSPAARASLVKLILQAAHYQHVKVVFSCRPFDLDNDHQYRRLLERNDTIRVDLKALDWDCDIVPVLEKHAIQVNSNNEKLKQLLILPVGLTLAVDLSKLGLTDLRQYYHLSQLYEALLKAHNTELQMDTQLQWTIYRPLEAIANSMSQRQELSAPLRVLDPFPKADSLLQRLGLIVINGSKISLRHESFFDYLHARAFVGDGKSLMDLLRSEEQTLFRRTQVRQILSHLREEDSSSYHQELRAVLTSADVRQHIKEFVLNWLATVTTPLAHEWDIVSTYAEAFSRYQIRGTGTVIYNSGPWFRLLSGNGVTSDLLRNPDEDIRLWGLSFLRTVAGAYPDDVAREVRVAMDTGNVSVAEFLNRFFWLPIERPAPVLADLIVAALGLWDGTELNQGSEGTFEIAATWAEKAPDDAARIFGATLKAWERLHHSQSVFEALDRGNSSHYLEEISRGAPQAFLEATVSSIRAELGSQPSTGHPSQTDRWRYRIDHGDGSYKDFFDHIRTAFGVLARTAPSECRALLMVLEPTNYVTALHLLLKAVSQNPAALADLMVRELDNPAFFEAGTNISPAGTAAQAIKASWPYLTSEDRAAVEARILRLQPELEAAARHYSYAKTNPGDGYDTAENLMRWARDCLSLSGLTQWSVLQSLDPASLSSEARIRLSALDRKFKGQQRPVVASFEPVPSQKVSAPRPDFSRLSDAQVLKAMEGQGLSSSRRPRSRFGSGDGSTLQQLTALAKQDPTRALRILSSSETPPTDQIADAVIRGLGGAILTSDHLEMLAEQVERAHIAPTQGLISLLHAHCGAWLTQALALITALARSGPTSSNLISISALETGTAYDRAFKLGAFVSGQFSNSIRGMALNALALSALRTPSMYGHVETFVDEVISQTHPAYIYAALLPFLRAGLGYDTAKVADRINRIFDQAPQALLTDEGRHILFHLESREPDAGRLIIERMTASSDRDVHIVGALLTLDKGFNAPPWKAKIAALIAAGVDYRVIQVALATSYLRIDGFREAATLILVEAFNDPEVSVRKEAAKIFNRMEDKDLKVHEALFQAYAASPHFEIDTRFLPTLVSTNMVYESLLLDFIDIIVDRAEDAPNTTSHSLYFLWDQIQRIYSSNRSNPVIIKRCLNIIDALYRLGTAGDSKLAVTG